MEYMNKPFYRFSWGIPVYQEVMRFRILNYYILRGMNREFNQLNRENKAHNEMVYATRLEF